MTMSIPFKAACNARTLEMLRGGKQGSFDTCVWLWEQAPLSVNFVRQFIQTLIHLCSFISVNRGTSAKSQFLSLTSPSQCSSKAQTK